MEVLEHVGRGGGNTGNILKGTNRGANDFGRNGGAEKEQDLLNWSRWMEERAQLPIDRGAGTGKSITFKKNQGQGTATG